MGGGSYMNGNWFLYEWKMVLICMGSGSYMSAKPLIGAALLHKNVDVSGFPYSLGKFPIQMCPDFH